jgi:hypothetical protein
LLIHWTDMFLLVFLETLRASPRAIILVETAHCCAGDITVNCYLEIRLLPPPPPHTMNCFVHP